MTRFFLLYTEQKYKVNEMRGPAKCTYCNTRYGYERSPRILKFNNRRSVGSTIKTSGPLMYSLSNVGKVHQNLQVTTLSVLWQSIRSKELMSQR